MLLLRRPQAETPSRKELELFLKEVQTLAKLHHRNIVQFYGACLDMGSMFFVTELMKAGAGWGQAEGVGEPGRDAASQAPCEDDDEATRGSIRCLAAPQRAAGAPCAPMQALASCDRGVLLSARVVGARRAGTCTRRCATTRRR